MTRTVPDREDYAAFLARKAVKAPMRGIPAPPSLASHLIGGRNCPLCLLAQDMTLVQTTAEQAGVPEEYVAHQLAEVFTRALALAGPGCCRRHKLAKLAYSKGGTL